MYKKVSTNLNFVEREKEVEKKLVQAVKQMGGICLDQSVLYALCMQQRAKAAG